MGTQCTTILGVDDDRAIRRLVEAVLEDETDGTLSVQDLETQECKMRVRCYLGMAALAALLLALNLVSQEKKKEKPINVQGTVLTIDKSTIAVKTGNATRQLMFGGDTKFLYGHSNDNKPGSSDQVKEGNYISCSTMAEQSHLMARECVYREGR